MGLLTYMMFGNAEARSKRINYNSIVEDVVKNHFNIDLDHITNSYYSRASFYRSTYQLYNSGSNSNEAAATVVGDNLESMLRKSGMSDDADNLVDRIQHLVPASDGGDDFVWVRRPGEGL